MSEQPWTLRLKDYLEKSLLTAPFHCKTAVTENKSWPCVYLTNLEPFLRLLRYSLFVLWFWWSFDKVHLRSISSVYRDLGFLMLSLSKKSRMGHIQDQLLLQFPGLNASDGRKEEKKVFLAKLQIALGPPFLCSFHTHTLLLSVFHACFHGWRELSVHFSHLKLPQKLKSWKKLKIKKGCCHSHHLKDKEQSGWVVQG